MEEFSSLYTAAARLASLLTGPGGGLAEPEGSDLLFEPALSVRKLDLTCAAPPADVWAVDGGQALVADARCLQVYVTRSARVRWSSDRGRIVAEEEGPLQAHLLGLGEERQALAALESPIRSDASVDVNLLRDWAEWSAVATSVLHCEPGGVVLIDGDLQPDWRIPAWWLSDLFARASARGVTLVGVTKHTSLSWGGAPLLGVLERLASAELGERECWWIPIAHTRPDAGPGIQVVVARLDLDARFAFRVDLPGDADPRAVLGSLGRLCDDAAFPGYPYPLSAADKLAACSSWLRDDAWHRLEETLSALGVPEDVRERAFADRHRLMERA
jgi:hypothetical protein